MQILGAIGHVIRVLGQKTEMPIGGSNRFSSKTICRRIKLSNLEAPGMYSSTTFELFEF